MEIKIEITSERILDGYDVVWEYARDTHTHIITYGAQVCLTTDSVEAGREYGLAVRHKAEAAGMFHPDDEMPVT